MNIRSITTLDHDALWPILEPVVRAGETYTLPRDMSQEATLAYWLAPVHQVCVAENNGVVIGTYYLRPNAASNGDHVANRGYITQVRKLMVNDNIRERFVPRQGSTTRL